MVQEQKPPEKSSSNDVAGWPAKTQLLLESKGYTDIQKISFGSYSIVYSAVRGGREKNQTAEAPVKVAIKFINLSTTSENYKTHYFPKEMEAIKTLKNKHLVHVFEVIEEKNSFRIFVVMELCRGDLLTEVETRAKVSEDQGRIWCQQVIRGLMYLHSKNWIHRDMKIENILLTFKNEALISDFTFSRQQRPPILASTFCGSLQYAAPEILDLNKAGKNTCYDGFKSDIWSTGIIMFAMHSGFMPVASEREDDIRKEQDDIQHKVAQGVFSASLKDLLRKFLAIDPKTRISLKEALKHKWFQEKSADAIPAARLPKATASKTQVPKPNKTSFTHLPKH